MRVCVVIIELNWVTLGEGKPVFRCDASAFAWPGVFAITICSARPTEWFDLTGRMEKEEAHTLFSA